MLWNLIKDYDVIFYVSPKGVEIEDNGVRTTDAHYRNSIDIKIKSIISTHKSSIKKLAHLQGSTENRIKTNKRHSSFFIIYVYHIIWHNKT